jgi:hypothetical protein
MVRGRKSLKLGFPDIPLADLDLMVLTREGKPFTHQTDLRICSCGEFPLVI